MYCTVLTVHAKVELGFGEYSLFPLSELYTVK
jgi:hypothetical protein